MLHLDGSLASLLPRGFIAHDPSLREKQVANQENRMSCQPTQQSFPLGQTFITQAAKQALHPQDVLACLWRHAHTDWGDCSPQDTERKPDRSSRRASSFLGLYCTERSQVLARNRSRSQPHKCFARTGSGWLPRGPVRSLGGQLRVQVLWLNPAACRVAKSRFGGGDYEGPEKDRRRISRLSGPRALGVETICRRCYYTCRHIVENLI